MHFEVDADALDQLVAELRSIKAELEHIGAGVSFAPGVNVYTSVDARTFGDQALAGSVLHFIDNWRQGREKIIFSLDNAIKAAENAGQMYREADGAIAKSARGED